MLFLSRGEYLDDRTEALLCHGRCGDQGFDGFALAAPQFKELRDGGDEIGWHYHAYNYVHRDDLDHATKLAILEADLEVCAGALQARHPDFHITSFRFGWFFVPDYTLYATLQKVGITIDASVRLDSRVTVGPFKTKYLPPITQSPARVGGISCFPFSQTLLVHDWNVVAHDLGWSRRDAAGAAAHQAWWRDSIVSAAAELKREGGVFSTYAGFPCHELPELSLG
ncbi:MAG: hypothetical protein HY268_19945 [Deltaproteobacteria bacterium]|nr:hypothetical protein [Deltaproteobacteria bacterium]